MGETGENDVLAKGVDSTWEGDQEGSLVKLDLVMPQSMELL